MVKFVEITPISVMTVDDDPLIREAYGAFFGRQEEFSLVGEARNGREGVSLYSALRPDVVLMDLQMPGMPGTDAIALICFRWPEACVVALTTFSTREYVVEALRAGAAGYLLKDVGGDGLLAGIRQAIAGDMPLSPTVRRQLVATVAAERTVDARSAAVSVTSRETELLGWLARGLTNHEIGLQMYISEGSVKQYLARIGDKLGARPRTQILIRAIQLNLVDPNALPLVDDRVGG
jgi:DNA-binding NarL/FixJ family response regulator